MNTAVARAALRSFGLIVLGFMLGCGTMIFVVPKFPKTVNSVATIPDSNGKALFKEVSYAPERLNAGSTYNIVVTVSNVGSRNFSLFDSMGIDAVTVGGCSITAVLPTTQRYPDAGETTTYAWTLMGNEPGTCTIKFNGRYFGYPFDYLQQEVTIEEVITKAQVVAAFGSAVIILLGVFLTEFLKPLFRRPGPPAPPSKPTIILP